MIMFPVSNTVQLCRLSVLKWLLVNRGEGCTINAINWAARRYSIVETSDKNMFFGVRRLDSVFLPAACSMENRGKTAVFSSFERLHQTSTRC